MRLGYMVNPSSMVYVGAGYQFEQLKVPALATFDGKGLALLVGFETDIMAGWRVGIEGMRVDLGSFSDGFGTSLKPADYSARLTVKHLFWLGQ